MTQGPVERNPPDGPLETGARTAPGPPAGRGTTGPDGAAAVDGDPVPPAGRTPLPAPDTGALRKRGPRPRLGGRRDQLSPAGSGVSLDAGETSPSAAASAGAGDDSSAGVADDSAAGVSAAASVGAGVSPPSVA